MRKLAIALTVVMLLALATPAFAANLQITGSLTGWVQYKKANGLQNPGDWQGGFDVVVKNVLSGASVSISSELKGSRTFPGGWNNGTVPYLTVGDPTITIKGALRDGGQDLTLVIGKYNSGIFETRNNSWGFNITGLSLGVVTTQINWVADNPDAIYLRFSKAGDPIKGQVDIRARGGVVDHKGEVTVVPTDKVDVKASYWNNGKDYKVSSNVKATDLVSLYGEVESNKNYKVQASAGKLTQFPFDPTLTVGYRKAGNDTGYFVSSEMVVNPITAFVSYDDIDDKLYLIGGTGAIYGHAKTNKWVNPFDELYTTDSGRRNRATATGAVAILEKAGTTKTVQLAGRYDLASLINLGLQAGSKIEARAYYKANVDTGATEYNLVGLIASTKVSAAGFNNIDLTATFVTNLKDNKNDYKFVASYTAPNTLTFSAGYSSENAAYPEGGFSGDLFVKASKTLTF